ncbi:hypothetical protein BV25DRAFT_1812614 [Artomyces pyxidatus]|uniref:Uncharacterized protein n=1 Tax=Artomyces pyxidatus TaxID=48021 RepID=A0ACB8SM85_9AGAM|nr:hypothetical protein BV25DRAFT_1812614 [Artomyces pyxidatus]
MSEYIALIKQVDYEFLYTEVKRWFIFATTAIGPASFIMNAPFGRFSTPDSLLALDGIKSWIFMELVSPIAFLVTLTLHPFSRGSFPVPTVSHPSITPQFILTSLYFIHYSNRALISPLRTPSRARSHLSVVFFAVFFNGPNGFLLSAFLSSDSTAAFLATAYSSPRFWLGVSLWLAGFIGNIAHDEILLNIRRKAKAKGKGREGEKATGPHYAIPHGGLYRYISYPNYLCEWVEWLGFALAAGPAPSLGTLPSVSALASAASIREAGRLLLPFADSVTPPWAFFLSEVVLMVPRAVRGHQWYHTRFGDAYPSERRAVIPWLL